MDERLQSENTCWENPEKSYNPINPDSDKMCARLPPPSFHNMSKSTETKPVNEANKSSIT